MKTTQTEALKSDATALCEPLLVQHSSDRGDAPSGDMSLIAATFQGKPAVAERSEPLFNESTLP